MFLAEVIILSKVFKGLLINIMSYLVKYLLVSLGIPTRVGQNRSQPVFAS